MPALLVALAALSLQAAPPAPTLRTITVQVLHGEQPAPPDTEVRLSCPSRLCGTAQHHGAPMRRPDARGFVTFEAVEAVSHLRAHHPALGDAQLAVVDGTDLSKPLVLRFPVGLPVSGRVVDAKGRPVSRARVAVISRDPAPGDASAGRTLRMVVANQKDGTFEFGNLRAGTWAVVADAFDEAWSPGVEVQAGATGLEVQLPALRWFTGRVVDAAGQPVKAPWLHLRTVGRAQAAGRGQLEAPRTPEAYARLLRPSGEAADPSVYRKSFGGDAEGRFELFVPTSRPVELWAEGPARSCTSTPRVVLSSPGQDVVLRLPALARLVGKALGPGRRPAPEVRLAFAAAEDSERQLGCDADARTLTPSADGSFTVEALPAHFTTLAVELPQGRPHRRRLALRPGQTVDLGTIVLSEGARLVGRVLHADGQPEGFATVFGYVDGAWEELDSTDETGAFEREGLPPGPLRVRAETLDSARTGEQRVSLVAGQARQVELRLPRE